MGVGGKFWDLLKPYARHEGPDFLREKRVAVDLSYWIVQHETAIKATHVRKPHLRLTFFRTINLFSKFGALPVFVVDGTPSPLKSKARIARFFRFSGVDVSGLPVAEGVSAERNKTFLKCVQECVELLELFGMPVLKANGEAEALCAQLNAEGLVDACITADSDAFLFGAKCVIKCVKPNTKEPFECYHISDVEAGLGLKRKHLIAISLLVGNDHDLNGVQGIGLEKALRFVQSFSEDEILNQLHEISNGNSPSLQIVSKVVDEIILCPDESPARSKTSHCSFCGHPGSKRAHFKSSCEYCGTSTSQGCTRKAEGFKCNCSSCNKDRKEKEQQKHENWHIKVCNKISTEPNFPNDDIIRMYLCNKHGNFTAGDGLCLSWRCPDTEILVDFLDFHQHWEPSYVRQRMLPMLSTIYLREMAAKPEKTMLYGQYVFDSIQRVKIRYGHQSYVIRWRKGLPYDKKKIVGTAGDCERLVAEINMERKKSHKAKTKPSEGRKQLSSVRVIQRNLVYIVGLPLNLADEDLLQHKEYFGQYGKVLKVSMSRTAAGVIQQFPNNTCSVYITYSKEEEAIRCIQSVHGFVLDGRSLKACFGTTKYCHAWLRNVPCTNPDCLYLHEIGSQEDSFTKDEIISAYTRSRVQQITGAPSSPLWRSGSMLPPPADDYCNSSSASAAKPVVKNASDNIMSNDQGSPPTGSAGRSMALPAAASWGTRASNQPQATSLTQSNGPIRLKPDTASGMVAFSSAVASTSQGSMLQNDVGRKVACDEESQSMNGKGKLDLKSAKHHVSLDSQATAPEKPAIHDATATVTLSNQSSCPLPSVYNGWDSDVLPNITKSFDGTQQSPESEKEGFAIPNGNFQNSLPDISSMKVDSNIRSELSGVTRTSSFSDGSMIKSPGNQGLQPTYAEQYCEPTSLAAERTGALEYVVCASSEQLDWRTDQPMHAIRSTVSEVEEDILAVERPCLKDPEEASHDTYLLNSAHLPHIPNHYRSSSLQHTESFGAASLNSDSQYADTRVSDLSLLHSSSNCVTSNGYPEKLVSSSACSDRNIERSFSLLNGVEGKNMGRSLGDADSNGALDVGESSIISNILSLDLDAWDNSLTSPQNLAKLLSETDKQPSSLKMSSNWKVQNNNNQSRFSFARQEELRSQTLGVDPSLNVFGKLSNNYSSNQDFGENRNSYLEKLGIGNSFSSSIFEEPENFTFSPSTFSSNRPPISRSQISAPPGFSVPSRAPPPGFSSHERMEQSFDIISGNHLLDSSSFLRNSFQSPPTGNAGSAGEIEFMDPAILAVGKGRLQGGLNNLGVDMRSNFPQQLHHFDNEARLQLLMQRSLPPHQNTRYADTGDSFSSLNDSFGISSRLVDQSQISGLSPYAQLSLQQSRNGLMPNGRWDGWNEVQGGNSLRMTELLRNERVGFNKFYTSGYEDSKFRMPSSDDLYNRTFEM